ncbi:MAG: hypothetical protein H7Y11_05420 [Armatimonadetes bacterium]|nr:hypothetical protein [Anaerolineae bacterium]
MRRLLWIIIPALLLLAAFQLSRVSASWRFIVPDAPGTLLYASGFDATTAADDWEQAFGLVSAALTADALQLAVNTAPNSTVFAPLRWYWRDFDFTVDAVALSGPENNGFGVLFHQTDLENYAYFLISSDGYYSLSRVLAGQPQDLSVWIPSPLIETGMGARNRLRVVAQGGVYRFYVNGQPLAMCIPDNPDAQSTYNDLTGECLQGQMLTDITVGVPNYGRVGVVALSVADPDVLVAFDNAVLYSPSEPPA